MLGHGPIIPTCSRNSRKRPPEPLMDHNRSVFAALFAAEILWPFLGFVAPCRKRKRGSIRSVIHTPRRMTLAQAMSFGPQECATPRCRPHACPEAQRRELSRIQSSCGLSEAKPGKLEGSLKLPGNGQLRPLCRQTGADEDLTQQT